MVCRKCDSPDIELEYREAMQQYLTRCNACKAVTWQPKEGTKNRESKHKDLVKKKGLDYCECCLRKKEDIPAPGTLEAHHILEYAEGGTDDLANILILCTYCHKDTHQKRTYLGHYKKIVSNE